MSPAPARLVAFLRAINVGGRVVKMDRLRAVFASAGFENVTTFIASGNVIFDARRKERSMETRIEAALAEALGYEVATFIRTSREIADIAAWEPFDGRYEIVMVAFIRRRPSAEAQRRLMALRDEGNAFAVREREIYWGLKSRFSESSFTGALLEKTIGMPATLRNMTTVRRLAAKLG